MEGIIVLALAFLSIFTLAKSIESKTRKKSSTFGFITFILIIIIGVIFQNAFIEKRLYDSYTKTSISEKDGIFNGLKTAIEMRTKDNNDSEYEIIIDDDFFLNLIFDENENSPIKVESVKIEGFNDIEDVEQGKHPIIDFIKNNQ